MPKPNYHVELINFNELDIRGFYVNKIYDVTWFKNDKVLLQSMESSSTSAIIELNNIHQKENPYQPGYDYEFSIPDEGNNNYEDTNINNHFRKRRSLWQNDDGDIDEKIFRVFNSYTGAIDEYHSSYKIETNKDDETLKNLPKNRTIFFDCIDDELNECIEAQFTIHNFRPGSEPISINMNFSLDLAKIGESSHFSFRFILNDKLTFFIH